MASAWQLKLEADFGFVCQTGPACGVLLFCMGLPILNSEAGEIFSWDSDGGGPLNDW